MAWKDKVKQNEYWNRVKDKYNSSFKEKYHSDPVFRAEVLQKRKEWRKNNPDKVKQFKKVQSKRRLAFRFEILNRDNFTCQYCGQKAPDVVLEIDHIFPKSKGGINAQENYKTSCRVCDIGKGDKLLNHPEGR